MQQADHLRISNPVRKLQGGISLVVYQMRVCTVLK